jgi:hopanoid biosynthesis associated RND transporter like protein HpnN
LLTVARPGAQAEAIGFPALAPLDRWMAAHRSAVLGAGGAGALAALALLPLLHFDFNPMHLRSDKAESVATLEDLMSDPDRTPNTIDALAPSLADADALAQRLERLPEVDHVVSLRSFVPDDQPRKLAVVQTAAALLDLVINPLDVRPPPTDSETAQSLAQAADKLRQTAGGATTDAAREARRLAASLDTLAQAPDAALRATASTILIAPLSTLLDQVRAVLQPEPVTLESLPPDLVADWVSRDGRARLQVFPKGDSNDNRVLRQFAAAVRAVAPDATGAPILIQEAAATIVGAFVQAGLLSFVAITVLLGLVLRRALPVIVTLIPVLLTGLLTLGSSVLVGPPLDFADIIALPLLFGIGVAFNIYFVVAWQAGNPVLLQSSLTRGVLFSALTTGTAFGSLWLSSHPGTANMGKLLMMSLAWTLATTLLFQPALLGALRPRRARQGRSPASANKAARRDAAPR